MKTKFFTILLCTIVLISCSKEETNTEQDSIVLDSGGTLSSGTENCVGSICDLNYVFLPPDPSVMYHTINIRYDPNVVDEEDIFCIRYEYFECHSLLNLRYPILQSTDPFDEIWKIEMGKPDDGLNTALCNDPRHANSQACDD